MTYIPTDDGRWVSEEYERLARVVKDYDPQYELRWIPPEHRETPEDRANCYCIVELSADGERVVMYAGELTTPEGILERLFNSDMKQGDVLSRLENRERARKVMEMKQKMDEAEERQDYIAFLIGTKKNYINMGNGRVVDDQLRTIRRGRR